MYRRVDSTSQFKILNEAAKVSKEDDALEFEELIVLKLQYGHYGAFDNEVYSCRMLFI